MHNLRWMGAGLAIWSLISLQPALASEASFRRDMQASFQRGFNRKCSVQYRNKPGGLMYCNTMGTCVFNRAYQSGPQYMAFLKMPPDARKVNLMSGYLKQCERKFHKAYK